MDRNPTRPKRRDLLRCARTGMVLGVVACLLLVGPIGPLASEARAMAVHTEVSPATVLSRPAVPTHSADGPSYAPVTPSLSPPVEWVNVTGTAAAARPPPTDSGSTAYDPLDGETVAFGGCTSVQCPENQTWAFSNGSWTNLTNPHDAPPARYGAVMDFDPNMGGLLLFGGHGLGFTDLNDTWLFRAGEWTNLSRYSPVTPSPREYASMAFDPDPEENGSVLFGGNALGVGATNDTWIWQGASGWVPLAASTPPPTTYNAQMAYDPVEGAIVLFGCGYGCGTPNETWELYSGQWWQVLPSGSVPSYRYSAGLTYDAALSSLVLFGGFGFSGALNETWTFSQGAWTNVSGEVGPAPPARWLAGVSPDSSAFPPLLVGGINSLFERYSDTWVLEVRPTVGLAASPLSTEVTVPVTLNATVHNGTAPYRAVFEFGDGGVALASSSTTTVSVRHTYLAPGSYRPSVRATDAAGIGVGTVATTNVTVAAGPTLGPLTEPAGGDRGIPISFSTGAVSNGTAPYSYLWNFGDGASTSGASANHTYAVASTYSGHLTVADALGVATVQAFTEVVHPPPTVSVSTLPGAPATGATVAFYGNVSGGTPPYRYAWSFGDGTGSSSAIPVHNYSMVQQYSAQLWVNDSVGGSVRALFSVTVSAPTGSPPPSGNSTSS
ncbi:MAG TPA: PKD domain-containing protein, partial [Thermoplasmata archaeon]|nr:PKD domain-containing protein [Thermoplasmata archaeon]